MTRETRIGLLVGLVFIVMFGLVLAEFTGNKSGIQPTPAMADKNKNSYAYQMLPKFEDFEPQPAVAQKPAPSPAASAPQPAPASNMTVYVPPPTPGDSSLEPIVHVALGPIPSDPPEAPAARAGTPPTPPTPLSDSVAVVTPPGAGAPPPPPAGRVYVVEDKDTFIKIARKLYGADHEGEYKKIMDANKTTVKEAAGLKVGMKLVIPPVAGVPVPPPAVAPAPIPAPAPAASDGVIRVSLRDGAGAPPPAVNPATQPASGARTYVVKSGDTVAKIARKYFNDDSKGSIDKILKANKLDAPEKLRAGATLEIPS